MICVLIACAAAGLAFAGRRRRHRARYASLEQLAAEGGAVDYIIVGGGSAGCACLHALATRLPPGATVLLLEAGPDDSFIMDVQVR